jgi:hypothetical protein
MEAVSSVRRRRSPSAGGRGACVGRSRRPGRGVPGAGRGTADRRAAVRSLAGTGGKAESLNRFGTRPQMNCDARCRPGSMARRRSNPTLPRSGGQPVPSSLSPLTRRQLIRAGGLGLLGLGLSPPAIHAARTTSASGKSIRSHPGLLLRRPEPPRHLRPCPTPLPRCVASTAPSPRPFRRPDQRASAADGRVLDRLTLVRSLHHPMRTTTPPPPRR